MSCLTCCVHRLERTLEDAKENCEHILKVNVAYIEKLQVLQSP